MGRAARGGAAHDAPWAWAWAVPWALAAAVVMQSVSEASAAVQYPAQPSSSTARYRMPLGEATVSPKVVDTRYGRLQGLHLPLKDTHRHLKNLNVWLGVPYATPPVGGNRFSPTRTPSPWDGVRPATSPGPACPQLQPDIHNETLALLRMPRARLQHLRRLLPYSSRQSEDCLYLNIYAPAPESGESSRKPVLVFIHGESYEWNSGNAYDGSVLATYADVVVVTVNYRLGILGFLNANPAPGAVARVANYGLMDQLAALHWLQQNAALFGGDPSSVTLMGHGSGAACIQFLMVSPTSTPGLFHRAILLSGSALSSWALVEDPVQYAVRLAHQVNCTLPDNLLRDHEAIVDCLRETPLSTLLHADVRPPTFLSAFGPSVDGVVIKHDVMRQLLTAPLAGQERAPREGYSVFEGYSDDNPGAFSAAAAKLFPPGLGSKGYDLLFGVVTGEALLRFPERDLQNGFEPERRDRILRTYVRNVYSYHLHEIFSTAVNEYTDWERTELHPINTRDATVSALSDAQFVAPVVQMADLLSAATGGDRGGNGDPGDDVGGRDHASEDSSGADGGEDGHAHDHHGAGHGDNRAYFYVFDYQFKDSEYPQRMGTAHGEELAFVWGAPLVNGWPGPFSRNYTKSEVGLSEAMIMYWSNFMRNGNPNPVSSADALLPVSREKNRFRGITWGQYDPGHQKHLEISLKPRLKNHFRAHQLSVWLRLIPELHRAGMEDVVGRHNLFRNHHDPGLYDGLVRGPSLVAQGQGGRRFGNISLPESATTDLPPSTTCIGVIHYHTQPTGAVNGSSADAETAMTYSTALGVTIAIGCSLLVLNIVIFAGVYYQRDRARMEVKNLQQQSQSGAAASKSKYMGCPTATVEVEREQREQQAAMMLSSGTPTGGYPSSSMYSTGMAGHGMYHLATIKEQPCQQQQCQQQQCQQQQCQAQCPQQQQCQAADVMHLPPPPPPEMFQTGMVVTPVSAGPSRGSMVHTSTLPRGNAQLMAETSLSTANGTLPYFSSLPRPSCRSGGPPRGKQQQQQGQGALGAGTVTPIATNGGGGGGGAGNNVGMPAAALSEMRV